MSRAAVPVVVAIAAMTTFACNLDKLSAPTTGTGTNPLNATVSGDTTVAMGATLPLSVKTPTGALGNTVALRWSSDKPTVATVDSLTGVVTGVTLGTANIAARVIGPEIGEQIATALKIRVKYAGISIKAVDSLIAVGMTKALDVRGTGPTGTVIASIPFGAGMTITSRDTSIFDIDANGKLLAKKNGTARVFVSYDGAKDSTNVKVRQVTRAFTFVGTNQAGELPYGSIAKDRTLAIAALDSLNVAIAAPSVTWQTSDATTITMAAATGVSRALKLGTATITANSDGLIKTILARVTQVPATITKTAATDAQSAVVNTAVPVAPQVTVADSGNTVISGATVTFSVATGGGSVTVATPTTDATGKASVGSWTLGTAAGANTLLASSGTGTATFTATGTPGAAFKVGFKTQPVNAAVGANIAPAVQVAILDSLDNVVTTSTASVTLALGSGTGTLSAGAGSLTVAAVAGVATFSTLSVSASGAKTLIATSGSLNAATSNSFGIFGAATKVGFITTGISGTAGQPLGAIKVAVQDAGGNTVTAGTASTASVTITIASGVGTLGGTATVSAVAGIATFTGLSISAAGTFTLSAASTGLTSGTSSSITIAAVGPPAKLGFTVQPSNVIAGAAISPDIKVAVQDSAGVTNTSSTLAVTLAIETNAGNGTLSPATGQTLTVNAVNGVATFTGVNINKTGTAYKLNATSGTLTKAISNAFNVTAGAPTKVGFLTNPQNAVAGSVISPAIQVAIQDANGNTVTSSTANVTMIIGAGPAGAALGGTTTVAAVAGVASFSTLTLTPANSNYTLTASSPSLATATSPIFVITSSATSAIKLGFIAHPLSTTAATSFSPPISVAIQDANGSTVTTTSATIALTLTSTNGAALTGTTSVTTSSGVANFSNVQVPLIGTGYTITAAANGLTSATSNSFSITAGAPAKLGWVVQPANATAGVPFAQDLQVSILDAGGNLVSTATNNVTLVYNNNAGGLGGTLKGTLSANAVNGIATFPGVRITKAASGYTLGAQATGLTQGNSQSFDITAAPASALQFKQSPQNVTAGVVQNVATQVQVVDSLGNAITNATDNITVATNSAPIGAVITGTVTQAAVAGVATFADLRFRTTGFYTLAASAPNLGTGGSGGFTVSAAPAQALVWNFAPVPTGSVRNAPLLGSGNQFLDVTVVDSIGNVITSNSTTNITLSVNTGTGTLGGTLTKQTASGHTSFGDVTYNTAQTGVKLLATATGLTSAISPAFDVAAFGSATHWTWSPTYGGVAPTTAADGAQFSPTPKAVLLDQYNNIVASGSQATSTACLFLNNVPYTGNGNAGIGGTTSLAAVGGVVTFNGVFAQGFGDNFQANVACTFTGETSSAFDIPLAAPTTTPYDVAFDANSFNAFYIERGASTNSGTLTQVALNQGGKTTLASGLNFPGAVVTDGSNVYWIEDGNGAASGSLVKRVPIGGGTIVTMSTAMTNAAPMLVIDNGSLYFIANNGAQRSIYKLAANAATNTAPTALFTGACGTTCTPVFTLSGTNIYFYDGTSKIRSMTTAGATQTDLVTASVGTPVSIAVSGSTIFWGTSTNLLTAPIAGGSATSQVTFSGSLIRIAFDGSSIYSLEGTSLKRYAISGFGATTLATTAGSASRVLTFDNGNGVLYTDNNTTGRIRRVIR